MNCNLPGATFIFFLLFQSFSLFSQEDNQNDILNVHTHFSFSDQPLKVVLDSIEARFDLQFSFSTDQIDLKQTISLDSARRSLGALLDEIGQQANFAYKTIGGSIALRETKSDRSHIRGRKFSGKIIDNQTGHPIAYASVGLTGTFSGTVSNVEGAFDFHVSSSTKEDSIYVSMLGYKFWKSSAVDLQDSAFIVRLEPSTIVLNELVIMDQAPGGHEIMRKAVDNLRRNYKTGTITMDGFYRNFFKVNGKYVSLLEAAVAIEGGNIKKDIIRDKIFVREIRSNRGLEKTNSLFRESDENFLKTLLFNDMIRRGASKKRSGRSVLNYKKNEYVLDSVTTYHDQIVYIVSCQLDNPVFEVFMTPHMNSRFRFFIEAEHFAIIRIERESDFDNGKKPWKLGGDDNRSYNMVFNRFVQEYKMVDDKLYLNYFSSLLRFQVIDRSPNQIHGEEELVRELFINDITKGRQKEFSWHEQMKLTPSLEEKFTSYNTDFWTNYNRVRSSPIRDQILKDLEEIDSLETQFTTESIGEKIKNH